MSSRATVSPARPVAAAAPAAPLLRLASMIYESVLLFGVVFVVGYLVLSLARWTYPLAGTQRLVLQGVLFVVIGAYFVYPWTRSGQTLAMKSWKLRVVDAAGHPPRARTAILRYVLAWHLLAPGLIWSAMVGGSAPVDLLVFVAGAIALMLPALAGPHRLLLHDRLTATRVIREP